MLFTPFRDFLDPPPLSIIFKRPINLPLCPPGGPARQAGDVRAGRGLPARRRVHGDLQGDGCVSHRANNTLPCQPLSARRMTTTTTTAHTKMTMALMALSSRVVLVIPVGKLVVLYSAFSSSSSHWLRRWWFPASLSVGSVGFVWEP